MKSILKEKLILISTFIIFYLLVEITTFIWVDFSFLPKDILIDLVLAFALSSVVFLIKSRKWSIFYISFIYFLVIMLFFVNATMYSVYYDLFTLQQLQLIGEAASVINADLLSVPTILITVGYMIVFVLTMIFLNKYIKKHSYKVEKYYKKASLSFMVSILLVFGFFMINTANINTYVSDNNVTTYKRASLEQYGMIGYYAKELEDMFGNYPTDQTLIPYVESLPTDYYGLMEGKNVITILLESIQPFAINEGLTPNLYMLADEGLYFENSYSENKTNVSELISITGNYPSITINPAEYDYDFSYSMPSVLKEQGYKTTYLHDNIPSFYYRGDMMPQLGFDYTYFHDELYPGQDIWTWSGDYTLDSQTMDLMLPYFMDTEEPFYTFWATLSTHGPYNYGPRNKVLFEDYGYFDQIDQAELDGTWTNVLEDGAEEDVLRIRHYQAAVMDLDVAIGKMLDELEDNGLLDDTVIVLYGDHNVYYHNIYLKMFEDTNNTIYNMEMYHNYFCIYNPELTEDYLDISGDDDSTISKFVTPYNIVPTLMDLMGIQYNQNIFMGSSIFSEHEDVFYSLKLTGFFNFNIYSSDGREIDYAKIEPTLEEWILFRDECEVLRSKIGYVNRTYIEGRTKIE